MTTLVTTYTDANYNGYASVNTVDAAVAYFAVQLGTDFGYGGIDSTGKGNLIIAASRSLALVQFLGTRNPGVVNRFMVWPRTGLTYRTGGAVGGTSIPEEIVNYVAMWILNKLYRNSKNGKELSSKTVDGVTEVYEKGVRDYLIDDLVPMKQIPPEWLFDSGANSINGVGSIGLRRYP